MDNLAEFLWTVAASSLGTTVLLGSAAFLLRTQIGHWLSKDLEAIKAQHQRELEAYKVGLIAEVERTKATQDVRKAGALLVIEQKYRSLQRLHSAIVPLGFAIFDFVQSSNEARAEKLDRLQALSDGLDSAAGEAAFLSDVDRKLVRTYQARVGLQVAFALEGGAKHKDDALRQFSESWRSAHDPVEARVRACIQEMMHV